MLGAEDQRAGRLPHRREAVRRPAGVPPAAPFAGHRRRRGRQHPGLATAEWSGAVRNTMEIDGYQAVIQFDPDIDMFRGEFIGLNGGADFYAPDVAGLREEGATVAQGVPGDVRGGRRRAPEVVLGESSICACRRICTRARPKPRPPPRGRASTSGSPARSTRPCCERNPIVNHESSASLSLLLS